QTLSAPSFLAPEMSASISFCVISCLTGGSGEGAGLGGGGVGIGPGDGAGAGLGPGVGASGAIRNRL
ncbi:MAG: hypothetical protein LLF89_04030, partial [Spirochaetaceae bacterium]|nr:hypothetical protein [Spirochaetaceae bacterium]